MENYKKMILIEPDFMNKLKKVDNNETPLSRLDKEMQKILNEKMGDREKWILYLQTLQRYLHFVGEDRQTYHLPIINDGKQTKMENDELNQDNITTNILDKKSVTKSPMQEEDVHSKYSEVLHKTIYSPEHLLKLVPRTYIKKGQLLLNTILENKDIINWNNDGTVIIKNEAIPGSNIVDLFSDVLRPLKKQNDPIGWEKFANILKDLRIPLSYIGNPKRYEFINTLHMKDYKENNITPISNRKVKSRGKIDWEKWTPY